MMFIFVVSVTLFSLVSSDTLYFKPDQPDSVLCPDKQGTCPDNNTCCKLFSGQYGCCPLPEAVCCSDHTHCCPHGYTCDVTRARCLNGDKAIDWVPKVAAEPVDNSVVTCPDSKNSCSRKQTCCLSPSAEPGCCPFTNGVCCNDGSTCCPFKYSCDPITGKCHQPGQAQLRERGTVILSHQPSKSDGICPGGKYKCEGVQTCCPIKGGGYGCCPFPNGVCCRDQKHCCPRGYTCTLEKRACTKAGGSSLLLAILADAKSSSSEVKDTPTFPQTAKKPPRLFLKQHQPPPEKTTPEKLTPTKTFASIQKSGVDTPKGVKERERHGGLKPPDRHGGVGLPAIMGQTESRHRGTKPPSESKIAANMDRKLARARLVKAVETVTQGVREQREARQAVATKQKFAAQQPPSRHTKPPLTKPPVQKQQTIKKPHKPKMEDTNKKLSAHKSEPVVHRATQKVQKVQPAVSKAQRSAKQLPKKTKMQESRVRPPSDKVKESGLRRPQKKKEIPTLKLPAKPKKDATRVQSPVPKKQNAQKPQHKKLQDEKAYPTAPLRKPPVKPRTPDKLPVSPQPMRPGEKAYHTLPLAKQMVKPQKPDKLTGTLPPRRIGDNVYQTASLPKLPIKARQPDKRTVTPQLKTLNEKALHITNLPKQPVKPLQQDKPPVTLPPRRFPKQPPLRARRDALQVSGKSYKTYTQAAKAKLTHATVEVVKTVQEKHRAAQEQPPKTPTKHPELVTKSPPLQLKKAVVPPVKPAKQPLQRPVLKPLEIKSPPLKPPLKSPPLYAKSPSKSLSKSPVAKSPPLKTAPLKSPTSKSPSKSPPLKSATLKTPPLKPPPSKTPPLKSATLKTPPSKSPPLKQLPKSKSPPIVAKVVPTPKNLVSPDMARKSKQVLPQKTSKPTTPVSPKLSKETGSPTIAKQQSRTPTSPSAGKVMPSKLAGAVQAQKPPQLPLRQPVIDTQPNVDHKGKKQAAVKPQPGKAPQKSLGSQPTPHLKKDNLLKKINKEEDEKAAGKKSWFRSVLGFFGAGSDKTEKDNKEKLAKLQHKEIKPGGVSQQSPSAKVLQYKPAVSGQKKLQVEKTTTRKSSLAVLAAKHAAELQKQRLAKQKAKPVIQMQPQAQRPVRRPPAHAPASKLTKEKKGKGIATGSKQKSAAPPMTGKGSKAKRAKTAAMVKPMSAVKKAESRVVRESFICPGGKATCPAQTTCCLMKDQHYGCCPLTKAVCCDDHIHCCPQGTTCNSQRQTCDQSKPSPALKKITPPKQTSVICPDKSSACPDGNTCCKLKSGQYGCCPLPKATCCKDGLHCCPEGTVCDEKGQKCKKKGSSLSLDWTPFSKLPATSKPTSAVVCPDKYSCPDDTTCCKTETGQYACCPLPNAVCCQDGVHCCPQGSQCDSKQQWCSQHMPWFTKQPAIRDSKPGSVICPDKLHECPEGNTCCRLPNREWGCCPMPHAVCCSDHLHCCPQGYTCDVRTSQCYLVGDNSNKKVSAAAISKAATKSGK